MSSSSSSALSSLYNNASSSQIANTTSPENLDNEFLTMLMTELQNQDPIDPVDSTQMLAQQAQFESLSQMQDLNTNLSALISMQSVSQATSLIGETIVGTNSNTGASVTGQVVGIQFDNGTPVFQVEVSGSSTTVPVQLSTVTSIY